MKNRVELSDITRYFKSKEGLIGAGIGLTMGIGIMEGSLRLNEPYLKWNEIQTFRLQNLIVETLMPITGFLLGKTIQSFRREKYN